MLKSVRVVLLLFCIVPLLLSAREYNLYYGNLHSHSKYSPVDLYTVIPPVIESLVGHPRQAYAYARDSANIDILAITDHTHPTTPLVGGLYYLPEYWDSTRVAANECTEPGEFVALAGFEWSPANNNHINVFNTNDFRFTYQTDNLDSMYNWMIARSAGIGQFNHPTIANFDSFRYRADVDSSMYLFEMQNNAEANRYYFALDKGWRVGISANQDNHVYQIHGGIKWGAGNQLTGVWADSLTKNSILSAIRQMRTFGTLDRNFSLKLTANDSWMGSIISNGNIQFRIIASDQDSNDLINRIDIITNNGVVLDSLINVNSNDITWQPVTFTNANEHRYFYIRVIENDGNHIISSPIWTQSESSIEELSIAMNSQIIYKKIQIYPNPFFDYTVLNYTINAESPHVKISIYNNLGTLVRKLINGNYKTGNYQVKWDGRDDNGKKLNNGVYFCRFESKNDSKTTIIVLAK